MHSIMEAARYRILFYEKTNLRGCIGADVANVPIANISDQQLVEKVVYKCFTVAIPLQNIPKIGFVVVGEGNKSFWMGEGVNGVGGLVIGVMSGRGE